MSVEKFSCGVLLRKSIYHTFLVVLLFATSPVLAASPVAECVDATELVLDAKHYDYAGWREPVRRFRLELPAAGIVSLELVTEGAPEASAELDLSRGACGGPEATLLEQRPTRLVLAARSPGVYFFRVAAGDPDLSVGPYTLVTRFIAARVVEESFAPRPGPESPAGDPLVDDRIAVTRFYDARALLKSEPIEVDPDPGVTTPLPLPGKSSSVESLREGLSQDPGLLATIVTLHLAQSATFERVIFYPDSVSPDSVSPDSVP